MRLLKISTLLAVVFIFASCEDVLDNAQPSTAISQEQALSSAGGVEAIRASMYNRLQSFSYSTQYMLGPSALADDFTNRSGSTRFQAYTENSEGTGMSSWGTSYDLINDANLIINGIEEGVLDQETLDQFRGEAYALRAFAYHHLVRTFGYEPGQTPSTGPGAGFDLGVMIRTTPTLSDDDATYRPRKTVSEVYDLIISDLESAISILSGGDAGSRDYVSLAAAQAMMARVQLYAGNDQAANDYAQQALDNTSASLASESQVATMFDETTGLNPEGIFVVAVDPATEGVNQPQNNSLAVYTSQQYTALIPTQDVMDIYDSNDARLSWFGPCHDELSGEDEPGCVATHPEIANGNEELEIAKWAAERGQYADNLPFLRVSEMLLIQAEARLGDASGVAAEPLNEIRQARGLGDITPGTVTIDDVLEERRREFIGEGQRFFDLKRLGRTIRKAPETTTTNVQDVPYSDHRILDNIPYNQVSLSESNADPDSVLIQNPGY